MPYLNSSPNPRPGPSGSRTSPFTPDTPVGPSPLSAGPPGPTLPSMNSHFDVTQQRGSGDFEDSRRSSVDSRMHQGMDRLALGPTSPYTSANASQTSLALQRERGIPTNGYKGPRYSSGHMAPYNARSNDSRAFVAGRVAPPILENPRPEVYNAAEPVSGQPYAFPDPDAGPPYPASKVSRRNSYASSLGGSSVFTMESSRLPPGQQGLSGPTDAWRH